jgi:hypothetical protein
MASNVEVGKGANGTASDEENMLNFGITRVSVDQFLFGQYRYSNLKDAIAQAKRDAYPANGIEKL